MSADGDIVRDIAGVPTAHHDRCNSRDGRECDCYMMYWEPFVAALARLEAAEAERDEYKQAGAHVQDLREAAEAQRDALRDRLEAIEWTPELWDRARVLEQRDALARKLTDLGYDVDQILSEGS